MKRITTIAALVCVLSLVLAGSAAAQNTQTKQATPVKMGTSGGNVNDKANGYCCSGTLGSLGHKAGTYYILSNNHVMKRSDQAAVGEDISQPGMIDSGCVTTNSNIVADLSTSPTLKQNVDASIAQIRPGMVDTTGAILNIGVPNNATKTAALNMAVAKSGRTTGMTCGTVQALSLTVRIQYEDKCYGGATWVETFTNQVGIGNGRFSAGGDSGSLIVSADNASPVALLFAGSNTQTIANPIGAVLSATGLDGIVGSARTTPVSCGGGGGGKKPRSAAVKQAKDVKEKHEAALMADEAVLGVGVGADDVTDGAVIVVYVEEGRAHRDIPARIDGVKVKVIRTDKFRAIGWNEKAGQSCGK